MFLLRHVADHYRGAFLGDPDRKNARLFVNLLGSAKRFDTRDAAEAHRKERVYPRNWEIVEVFWVVKARDGRGYVSVGGWQKDRKNAFQFDTWLAAHKQMAVGARFATVCRVTRRVR